MKLDTRMELIVLASIAILMVGNVINNFLS